MQFDDNIGEVCRDLSKCGTFDGSEDFLRNLSGTIAPEDSVEIYIFFRDHAGRHETEWRDEFIALFPRSEPLLPPVDDSEYWQDELFGLVRSADRDGIVAFLRRIGLMDITFDPKSTYAECTGMGHPDHLTDVPFDFYPVEGEDAEGVTAMDVAQSLGHTEIVELLQGIVAELDSKYLEAYEHGRLMT
jgi:hypothetical protein